MDVTTSDGRALDATSIDQYYESHFDLGEEQPDFPITVTATARLKTVHYFGERDRQLGSLDASTNFMPDSCTETSSFVCNDGTCVGEFEMHAPGGCVFELTGEGDNGQEVAECWYFSLTDGPETRSAVEDAQVDCSL